MTEWAIEARGLQKSYRGVQALGGLDLLVPRVGVHALIGPNASGKTTAIRTCLGLTRPSGGTVHIFGHRLPDELAPALARVGAIVEQPRFTASFSGEKNLRLLADAAALPRARVGEALEAVGLRGRERDRYGSYSLGLRQRIAVAACLIKRPDLVILDEPTNGLDPQGVAEVLALMGRLRDAGRAVLVSSHHLPELSRVADTVTVIGHGRTLAQTTLAELVDTHGDQAHHVRIADPAAAAALLQRHGWVVAPGRQGGLEVRGPWPAEAITQQLAAEGLWVAGLEPATNRLEAAYLSLTDTHLGGVR